ncbi:MULTISPECIES: hypothetical protein [unclassified Paraburkholderia]|uniref:hypothetical protein n=1 Tax=unclassified Paraburkholderia TaxID=2615204 RepID=UPI002AB083D0|nr:MULTISPECIES: hypothetical protein [unclassified Paraburkholderia]
MGEYSRTVPPRGRYAPLHSEGSGPIRPAVDGEGSRRRPLQWQFNERDRLAGLHGAAPKANEKTGKIRDGIIPAARRIDRPWARGANDWPIQAAFQPFTGLQEDEIALFMRVTSRYMHKTCRLRALPYDVGAPAPRRLESVRPRGPPEQMRRASHAQPAYAPPGEIA